MDNFPQSVPTVAPDPVTTPNREVDRKDKKKDEDKAGRSE